jgi:hypothetical protein
MTFAKIGAAAALLTVFTACSKDTTGGTGGTGPTGTTCTETLINSFNVPACSNRTWSYELETQCWAGEAYVDIFQTGSSSPWEEVGHAMESMELGDDYEVWGLSLGVVDTPGEVTPGSTSLFKCDDEEDGRSSTMTWSFTVYDLDFNLADCVAYGDDPSHYSGCADGNTW